MTEKEKTLLAGCLAGEKAAWDAFVLEYSKLVYHAIVSTFRLYHADPQSLLVEDLYQEFFVSMLQNDFRKLRQFRGDKGCTLASWLKLVATRLTIDLLRKQGHPTTGVDDSIPAESTDPADSLIDENQQKLLAEAMEGLPPRDRLFIELHFYRRLSPEEIATMLRLSLSAVYTLKSRILAKLREILK
jgi:RNA polymerase sigma factor (sigma-70 family)